VLNDYILAFFIVVASSQILPLISQLSVQRKTFFCLCKNFFDFCNGNRYPVLMNRMKSYINGFFCLGIRYIVFAGMVKSEFPAAGV
jgi:hypothetical protein